MSNLSFISKLYRGRNCYSDHMSKEELDRIHISSGVENTIVELIKKNKIVFLTGNPGDGKTFIIKAIEQDIKPFSPYVNYDLNSEKNYKNIIQDIVDCYKNNKPALLAVNEYPFFVMCRDLKEINKEFAQEVDAAKNNIIVYNNKVQKPLGQVVIIDLNERNMLAQNRDLTAEALNKLCNLLKEDNSDNKYLKYNLASLDETEIRTQLIELINLAAQSCEHFAVRDILGALSFALTACTTDDYEGLYYFDALFEGKNPLLELIKQYDPIYLTNPELDERLWNGEITEGWINEAPKEYPNDVRFDDDSEEAIKCFKSIKRRYYFEHINGCELLALQPDEIKSSADIFNNLDARKKKIKKSIISSLNKLFLPSSTDKNELRIWTTHRYDLSNEPSVAVSSRYVSDSRLDLVIPRTADWLSDMEYMPDHLILKPKDFDSPKLLLDVDFIRTLHAIDNGYPVGLLAPKYVQKASMFLQKLSDNNEIIDDNDDDEIIVASRNQSFKRSVYVYDDKYSFEEEE